ncbi:MAG: porin family protein [Niabella sp.]
MKLKLLMAITFAFSFSNITLAQVKAGIKIGGNFSWFTNSIDPFAAGSEYYDDYIGFEKFFRSSVNGGLILTLNPRSQLSFSTEFLYSAKGSKHRYKNPNVTIIDNEGVTSSGFDTYTYTIDYLEIPVIVQPNFITNNKNYWSVYAGIAPAYAVNHKRVYRYFDETGYVDNNDREKLQKNLEDIRSFNFFPLAGFKYGETRAFIDLRASHSFLPVFTKTKNNDGSNLHTRMWTIGLSTGVYL